MEVCLFETLECLWIHFQMPRLVQPDVENAVRTLYQSLDIALGKNGTDSVVLNVPQYLFVSTQVADHFESLFESSVVRSFRSALWGRIAQRARNGHHIDLHGRGSWWTWTRRLLSSVSMTAVMLLVATMPVSFQRCACSD